MLCVVWLLELALPVQLASFGAICKLQAAAEQQRAPQQQLADPGELPPLLTGVRIVLVSPKTPANIGAVLRVAENFEVGSWGRQVQQ